MQSPCLPGLQRPQQSGPSQQFVDASGERDILRVGSGEPLGGEDDEGAIVLDGLDM